MPFRNGTFLPAAHLYQFRNGKNMPSRRSRGGKGARYSCYMGTGVEEADTVTMMVYCRSVGVKETDTAVSMVMVYKKQKQLLL